MIISRKRYNDLIAKIDDAKRVVDAENKLIKATLAMKAERDTLIDDIAVLKANSSRLERANGDLKHENKALRLQSNTYFDEWQESEKQRNEFISYVNLYTTLTDHIRLKAECNPGVSRYIDLVNYIDRLERD